MPFTISHIAAVIPIKLMVPRANFAALAIGSMSPDFTYIFNTFQYSSLAHSLPGLFLFCLPASSLVLLLYYFLQSGWAHALGFEHETEFEPVSIRSFSNQILIAIVCIIFGAFTHIIWDSFTHVHGYFVQQSPEAFCAPFGPYALNLPVFKWLQYGSTITGFIGFVAFTVYRCRNILIVQMKEKRRLLGWCGYLSASGASALLCTICFRNCQTLPAFAFGFAVSFMQFLALLAVLIGLWFRYRK